MKEGNVVLASIPQANGEIKNRPAIVLREIPPHRDLLVCGVSTQLHYFVENLDETISPDDKDFKTSGLLSHSLIRLGFLAVLSRTSIVGTIGSISPERHKRLLKKLSNFLIK